MAISAKDVSKLRQMTGAGMMDSKKALVEANGNFEEAITILRKKGQKLSAKRADREASEGVVLIKDNEGANRSILVALNCETDFVAKNEDFVQLAQQVLDTAVSQNPTTLEALKEAKVGEQSIQEIITEFVGKIGEKIEISAYEVIEAEKVISYIHSNAKLGVLLGIDGTNGADVTEVGKDIAMQIAAMKPVAIDKEGVDASLIEKEIEIGKEQARQEGKPENLLEKIAMGKLNKFYKESTLLNQQFVKDNSKTIKQLLAEAGKNLTVKAFKRVAIGA